MSKIAFMFPGQGAQTAGMGKDFYEHSEIARNIIDRSSGLLKLDMKSLCFEENENLHQRDADRGCDPGSSKERHFDAERRSGWKRRDGCGTWPGCRKD